MFTYNVMCTYVLCIATTFVLVASDTDPEHHVIENIQARKGVSGALCSEENQDRVKDCCVYSCCFFPWICASQKVLNWLSTYEQREGEKRKQRQVMRATLTDRI